jgi:hypothetical protein
MIRRLVLASRTCPHDDTQYELDTQDRRIVTMQPHPSTLLPDTSGTNPYSRPGNMDRGTTSEDADMEPHLHTHETGGDVDDSHGLPPPDSQKVPLPDSHEVSPSESEDIPHPRGPCFAGAEGERALDNRYVHNVWMYIYIYIYMHVYV